MGLIQQWKEFRQYRKREFREATTIEQLLMGISGSTTTVTREQALNIPAVSACVGVISDTVASIPIHLYKGTDRKVTEIHIDPRVGFLNDDTKDTLDGFQFKKALVEDYLLDGAGYAYINRQRNQVKSLHYVKHSNVAVNHNFDPIFKDYDIFVNGNTYRAWEFLKLTRKTINGVTGKGIVEENNKILSVAYNTLVFEDALVSGGGNKKGFLKSQSRLSEEAKEGLKASFNNLYKNNTENVIILNSGIEFEEASNTSVEMQLNENKKTNSNEIFKMFLTPPSILDGSASDEVYNNWIKVCILPILTAIQTAINKDLLLSKEKESFYFAFDTKELLKADIEKRYKAYEIGTKNGILQIDEARYEENLPPLGLNFIKLGLQDVLYDPKTKQIYTPNTNKTADMANPDKTLEGGEEDENRDPGEPGTT